MKRANTVISRLAALCIALVAAFTCVLPAWAGDKVTLKDNRVLEGTITEETDTWIRLKIQVGGITHTEILDKNDIKSIERDAVTTPTPKKEEGIASSRPSGRADAKSGVRRIAILNFGPPSTWGGKYEDMVGREVSAAAFDRALPVLKKDGVTDVVIRINSGGGALLEIEKFHKTFEEYKKNFRTVAWVESAISAAAMAPWVLEEFYMMPNGNIGACTGWYGALQAVKGVQLEEVLVMMERASRLANRDPKIMRSMQIQEPLSATIDPVTGNVKWFQDESGEKVLNPRNQILTFNAADAVTYKFAKAIAATKEELAEAMFGPGVEYEWAGREASEIIDNSIRTNDKASKEAIEVAVKYARAIQEAAQIQDRDDRGAAVGRARKMLNQLEAWVKGNPNLEFFLAQYVGRQLDREFFIVERERLADLMR